LILTKSESREPHGKPRIQQSAGAGRGIHRQASRQNQRNTAMARAFLVLDANDPDRRDAVVEPVELVRVIDDRRDLRRPF